MAKSQDRLSPQWEIPGMEE